MPQRQYCVYILTNHTNTVLYIGVTNDITRRVYEHKTKMNKGGFTQRYNVWKLVFCEEYEDISSAISREKQIKHWRREKKIALIQIENPYFRELTIY